MNDQSRTRVLRFALSASLFVVTTLRLPAAAGIEIADGDYEAVTEYFPGGGLNDVTIHGEGVNRSWGYVARDVIQNPNEPETYGPYNSPLVIRGAVDVYDSGLMELRNAPVVSLGTFTVRDGGQLWLANGTLQVRDLRLSGTGSSMPPTPGYPFDFASGQVLVRDYEVVPWKQTITAANLSLDNGATMVFRGDDEISAGVSISDHSTLTLAKDLTVGRVTLMGSSAHIDNLSHTVTTVDLYVEDGARFSLGANTVSGRLTVMNGGQFDGAIALSLPGSRIDLLTPNALTGGSTYATEQLNLSDAGTLDYTSSDSITDWVQISGSTTLKLERNLDLRGGRDFGTLEVHGPDSVLQTNGHAVLVRRLEVYGQHTFQSGDVATTSVQVFDGGALSLDGDLAVNESIQLSGPGALVTNGHSYQAPQLDLGGGNLTYGSTDSVTESLSVRSGTFTLDRDLTLSGTLTLTTSNALIPNGHTFSASDVVLGAGFGFGVGDGIGIPMGIPIGGPLQVSGMSLVYESRDAISNSVRVYNGSRLTLNRDIALTAGLTASGSNGLVLNGHHYSAASLAIDTGLNLTYGGDDLVTKSVVVGNGSTLTLDKDLNLTDGVTLIGTGKIVTNGHSYRAPRLDSPLAPSAELASIGLVSGTDPTATRMSFAAGTIGPSGANLQLSFTPGLDGQHSNILHLQGTDGIAQVLQLSYDPTGLSLEEQGNLVLAWLDGSGDWINSVLGNHNLPNPIQMSSPWHGTWASYADTQAGKTVGELLGAYGVDTTAHVVWAAIDHNSQFTVAAVPEPSALVLAGLGVLGMTFLRRRSRLP